MTITPVVWGRFAGVMTIAGVLSYFLAAFAPLPSGLTLLLVFGFGPTLGLSFLGWHGFLGARKDGPLLRSACTAGVLAGLTVTMMLVVQVGNSMVRADQLAEAASAADPDVTKAAAQSAFRAVNRVQYLLDVVWDLFLCTAMVLLAIVLAGDARFGRVRGAAGLLGGTGVIFGLALLALNLASFPYGPAEVGSVDLGPLAALWFLVAAIRVLFVARRVPSHR